MVWDEINAQFDAIEELIKKMNQFAPASHPTTAEFRADLARLLVIAIVSAYEASVRISLVVYARRHNAVFGDYIEANCKRLNARIKVDELKGLAAKFDPVLKNRFDAELCRVERRYRAMAHLDIRDAYGRLLALRHRFAHSASNLTSIEEVQRQHRIAKEVVYAFCRVLSA